MGYKNLNIFLERIRSRQFLTAGVNRRISLDDANTFLLDRLGLTLSVVCAVHCALTPFLIFLLPVFHGVWESPWVHGTLAFAILPVGLLAFLAGYQHHHRKQVLILGLIGLCLVVAYPIASAFWLIDQGPLLEAAWMIPGSVFLIIAHALNRRYCRCHTEHEH